MSKDIRLTHTTINNVQIPVIYGYSNLVPAGTIRLIFQGGGSLQDQDKIGLSALKDEMLNRGSKDRGNVGFAQALEQKAIALDVRSGTQTLNFELSYLKEEQTEAVALLGELLSHPNLTQIELDKAKTALIAKILANQNDFDYLADELLNQKLFAGTPLAQSKLGSPKDIERLTLKDIHTTLDSSLMLKRLIIVIGGDVALKPTLKALESILAFLPNGEPYDKQHFTIQAKPSSATKTAKTEQAYIYFGAPLKVENLAKEWHLAQVASFILGAGGFGSRLMEEVRTKRGLAYSAYIRYNTSPLISYASGYLQTKLESQDEAIQIVKETIQNFVENGVTQQELDDAKKFLLGSEPLRNETLSQRLNTAFSDYYLELGIGFSAQNLKRIEALDLATLNAYIKQHTEIKDLTFAIVTATSKQSKSTK